MNYNFFVDIDECQLKNPCANDGVCTNSEGTFNCLCTEGWTGRNCTEGKVSNTCICFQQTQIKTKFFFFFNNWCWLKIEENCLHQIDITHYSVLIAFMNSDVDECLFSPCGDEVPCINELGSYSCQCFSGWTGKNCTEGRPILWFHKKLREL